MSHDRTRSKTAAHPTLALWLLALLVLTAAAATTSATETPTEQSIEQELLPTPQHHRISSLVTRFIEKSHYTRTPVDDRLSRQVLDTYIDALDGNRQYFLADDIARFEQYRDRIDNMVVGASLDPVFDIFRTYQTRAQERWEYALSALEQEPDLTLDESFMFDREEAAWPTTKGELDELWRKRVKNDVLGLRLNEQAWGDAQETLRKRYTRANKQLLEVRSDDVFEIFMNGATPGKRVLGLRVVNADGTPVGWSGAVVRNLIRPVDALPSVYTIGLLSVLLTKNMQRLGDLAANTVVVFTTREARSGDFAGFTPRPVNIPLSPDEQNAIVSYGERAPVLNRDRADELAGIVSPMFNDAKTEDLVGHAAWLVGRGR